MRPLEQSYVFHRLVILGEAVSRLAPRFEPSYPLIPWRQIAGLRNRLVHAYFDLDLPLLWEIATTRVDEIEQQLIALRTAEFWTPPEESA